MGQSQSPSKHTPPLMQEVSSQGSLQPGKLAKLKLNKNQKLTIRFMGKYISIEGSNIVYFFEYSERLKGDKTPLEMLFLNLFENTQK